MKRIFVLAAMMCVTMPQAVVETKASGADEAAIKKVFADFAEAWGKDDAKSMASHWTEDGDLINPQGRVAKGRAEVEKLLADEHATLFKGTRIMFTGGDVRFLKPDVAVYTVNYEVPGAHAPDGSEMTAKGIVTSVMVKKNGKWWTTAARPMVPLGPSSQ